jgi:hypothetical protein
VSATFVLGKRTGDNACEFLKDLAGRLRRGNPERHPLSTDGFAPYPDAVESLHAGGGLRQHHQDK